MPTWSHEVVRARDARRARLPLGLAAVVSVLVAVTVVARQDVPVPSTSDLQRITEATELGCGTPTEELDEGTGFALDGTVLAVTVPPDPGAPVLVELQVHEWFRGPPLDRTRVRLGVGTVAHLRGAGATVGPGLRLLVSGRGWGSGQDAPAAAGCGRTRLWDRAAAEDWRAGIPAAQPVAPQGPLPRYPDAGFVRAGADGGPALTGVLLLDGGCLYVDDGLNRWVPVLPSSAGAWLDGPPRLAHGPDVVDVGHTVRLGGVPATGVHPGPRPLRPEEVPAARLDERGVPTSCRDDAPRFVVADPAGQGPASTVSAAADDPLVRAAVAGADGAGLGPGEVAGEVRRDQFGAHSVRVALQTDRAGEVLVHVENVAVLAWPSAYAPGDATFRTSLDPEQAGRLPRAPAGSQLAVVERADGTTQVLLRTGERVVVGASADPAAAPGEALEADALLDALTEVAAAVAAGPAVG